MSSRNCGSEEYYKTHASELTEQLYLAACRAVTSKCLLDLGITSIVNATLELPTVAYQKQDTIQIAVEDRISAKLNIYFDLIADKIQQVHSGGGKILIYCRAGQSRSATLCIAYFMKYHDMSYEEAFQYVKYRRPIIHPNMGFVSQLREYERKLKTKPIPKPIPDLQVCYAEEAILEDIVENEAVDIPIPPLKHGRPTASVHEPFQSLSDKYEIVGVQTSQICDTKGSAKAAAKRPATDKLSFSVQAGHPVASSWAAVRTIGTLKTLEPSESQARGKRKTATAFTRMTKPNEIAVIFQNIPLDLALASNINSKFKLQIKPENSTLAVAELHLHSAISQEQSYESVGHVPQALVSPQRAASALTAPRLCCTQHTCFVLDTNGTITFVTSPAPSSAPAPGPHVTKLSRQPSVKSRSLLRHGSSYQLQPRLAPAPAKPQPTTSSPHLTASVPPPARALVQLSDNLRHCAVARTPPVFWECAAEPSRGGGGAGGVAELAQKPAAVRRLRHAVTRAWPVALQLPRPLPAFSVPLDQYHKLDFSFAPFSCSQVAALYCQQEVGSSALDVGTRMTVCREFPYYSTVHFTSALELFRATEHPKLDIQWFKTPEAKLTKMDQKLELLRKSSEARMAERRRKESQLVVKWATERFHPDELQEAAASLALAPLPAQAAAPARHRPLQEAYSLAQPVDWTKLQLIGRFYVPHYNPALLRRTVPPSCHPAPVTTLAPALQLPGTLAAARTSLHHKAVARRSLHTDCMMAAVSSVADTRADGECVEDIPDEIHDISEMKGVLAEKTDSPRCKIWFWVFKRTLLKKKPTFPIISYTHSLLTSVNVQHLALEFVLVGTSHSSSLEVAASLAAATLPLGIASTRHVTIIEKYPESSRFSKPKSVSKKSTHRLITSKEYFIDTANISLETTENISALAAIPCKAISKVGFPNRLYCVQEECIHGLTVRLDLDNVARNCRDLARVPFSVVTRLLGVAETRASVVLGDAEQLPEYKFVQDIEDQADLSLHRGGVSQTAQLNETDSFWFFSLEQTAVLNETEAKTNNPSNFLLFLPDRKYAPKIGQEEFPSETDNNSNETRADLNLLNPEAVVGEVLQEIKAEEKRVTFDTPDQETEDSPRKQRVRTIYYGRDRSKSRTRLKDVESYAGGGVRRRQRERDRSVTDAEVMRNLAKSVDEANSILMRRRDPDTEPRIRETFSPSPERYMSPRLETRSEERFARRSRDAQRNREETERRERSRRGNNAADTANVPNQTPASAAAATTSSSTLSSSSSASGSTSAIAAVSTDPAAADKRGLAGGIISFASNLIGGGKSRREQSDNRARGLLRKSARNFL